MSSREAAVPCVHCNRRLGRAMKPDLEADAPSVKARTPKTCRIDNNRVHHIDGLAVRERQELQAAALHASTPGCYQGKVSVRSSHPGSCTACTAMENGLRVLMCTRMCAEMTTLRLGRCAANGRHALLLAAGPQPSTAPCTKGSS